MAFMMNREQKISYARLYVSELVARHAGIAGIILGGSVARGNDLPISDHNLWCFVDDVNRPLPVEKHFDGDLYIDIEQRPASGLFTIAAGHDWLELADRFCQQSE